MKTIIDIKSLIIGILVTVLFFTVIGAKNRNNVNFDTITANKINIVDAKGKHVAGLSSYEGQGILNIYNKHGKRIATLQANQDSDGVIALFDRYGDFGWSMTGKK